ncbi:aryl hydrocarbon receptor protein 1 isoform X2 [Folsomia candida]|uniref:aryl hydrocarbon receptor protein 1 isoform X2 n=1 Tax=Folsomia candida TaxID=158441 RepID=UPI000B8FE51B|nr:aryl hydrocarbon receptor protein 1 isoform X2 [Folsomia candida]
MLNVSMNQLGTVYATKRRRRNGKSIKPPPKDGMTKSNPSKRHRERLNAELDNLASLLPFEQNILSKLDRLSILRLAVSYLRTKSYFQVSTAREKDDGTDYNGRRGELIAYDHTPLDGEYFLQALNGFLLILTCDGEVFFATHSIESYLGFHQSDIVHQSVYELVHSEDREELQRQLMWNAFCPQELSGIPLQEIIHTSDHCHFLERSFTVRFRCLLDNTSGFLRLDIRGRIKVLHGQNRKSEDPPLALFALCTPFGPPSLLELPSKELMFKSKHKLDLSLVSMDQRGKMLFAYSDTEFTTMGGYELVHFEDLSYVASAHQELLKTGASGLIAYRMQTKDGQWQWLQTSSRLVYKNSKPDFIISTHRPLMNEEGRDLLGKRTMDFKVSYLDAGLTNSYFSDQDTISSQSSTPNITPTNATPKTRRYKTQLRDFLASCRSKRKIATVPPAEYPHHIAPTHPAETSALQAAYSTAAAAAAAYSTTPPYGCTQLYNNYGHPAADYAPQQNFYHPTNHFETNRYLENSLLYRPYYPDYTNASSWGCIYDSATSTTTTPASNCTPEYNKQQNYTINHQQHLGDKKSELKSSSDYLSHYTNGTSGSSNSDMPRQTVLMWAHQSHSSGRQNSSNSSSSTSSSSVIQPHHHHQYEKKYSLLDPLKSLSGVISTVDHHHPGLISGGDESAAITAKSLYLQGYSSGAEEVWAAAHHTHSSHHPHTHHSLGSAIDSYHQQIMPSHSVISPAVHPQSSNRTEVLCCPSLR